MPKMFRCGFIIAETNRAASKTVGRVRRPDGRRSKSDLYDDTMKRKVERGGREGEDV